ncbi:MarR family transcriptional regulator, partial [Streptomyces angustmyceticus]
QRPSRPGDFAHLPRREASIAAYLDRLPEGADISVKTLAKVLPDYGQCALRTALRRLSEAGHLRRVTETHTSDGGSPLWVTRTYFSRTPRDDAWWMALCAGNVPSTDEDGAAPHRPPASVPHPPSASAPPPTAGPPRPEGPHTHDRTHDRARRPRSPGYAALAALGRAEPRMTLSADDCASLEAFAEEWLARGATRDQPLSALTPGLPPHIHHPGRLARSRLLAKMPPETAEPGRAREPSSGPLRIMECTVCRTPGRPAALPGGICGPCRGEAPPDDRRRRAGEATAAQVRARVEGLRAVARPPASSGGKPATGRP